MRKSFFWLTVCGASVHGRLVLSQGSLAGARGRKEVIHGRACQEQQTLLFLSFYPVQACWLMPSTPRRDIPFQEVCRPDPELRSGLLVEDTPTIWLLPEASLMSE